MTYLWIYLGGLVVAWWLINKIKRSQLDAAGRGALVLLWPFIPVLIVIACIVWFLGAGWRDK